MADDNEKDASGGDVTSQPDAITADRAASGVMTATGREAARRADETEGGRATETAHDDEIEGAHADYVGEGAKPVGLQAAESMFVSNGALPPGFVPSTSGPVPISTATTSQEAAQKMDTQRMNQVSDAYNNTSSRQKITKEKLARMSRAEIAAVAHDRGYDISPAAGGRGSRSLFLAAQDKDEALEDGEAPDTAPGSGPIPGTVGTVAIPGSGTPASTPAV